MSQLRTLVVLLAAALAAPAARAAEVTRVTTAGPAGRIAWSAEARYEWSGRSGFIDRETAYLALNQPGQTYDLSALTYAQSRHVLRPTVRAGVWRALELRAELPYVLSDSLTWKGDDAAWTITQNDIDASGASCGGACPMFPIGQTFKSGGLDDLRLGASWLVAEEKVGSFFPRWVLSLDVTVPTAARFDPAAGRLDAQAFHRSFGSSRAAVGHKIWAFELGAAASQRMGRADAYLRWRLKLPVTTSSTYTNCAHAGELAAIGQMSSVAAANCAAWSKADTGARPPLGGGVDGGVELVAWAPGDGRTVTVDLRAAVDATGRGRWYDELTPATGKLLANDAYLTLAAQVGVAWVPRKAVRVGLDLRVRHDTDHAITGDDLGRRLGDVAAPGSADQNPNYDWRWDPSGRRFRVAGDLGYDVALSGSWAF